MKAKSKIKIKLVFLFLLFTIIGCKYDTHQDSGEVIMIDPTLVHDEILLSSIVDSVRYIKLETTENCMIARIHSIFIKENYIYVLDALGHSVFVFDKTGKLLTSLDKQGVGTGEYLMIGPLIIDPEEKFIEIISPQKILRYENITFQLISERPNPDIRSVSARYSNGVYYFRTDQITNLIDKEETNADIIAYKEGENPKPIFHKIIDGNTWFGINSGGFSVNSQGDLFVSVMYDNTFYQLKDMVAFPILTIDFGKHGINNQTGLRSLDEQLEYIKEIDGKAGFPMLSIYNDRMLAVSYLLKQNSDARMFERSHFRQYVKFRNSGKMFHTKLFKNDITGFPEYASFSNAIRYIDYNVEYKDYIVDVIIPDQIFTDQESVFVEEIGTVSIDDNPIIVLMRVKKDL